MNQLKTPHIRGAKSLFQEANRTRLLAPAKALKNDLNIFISHPPP
jgi:hypothetical protein